MTQLFLINKDELREIIREEVERAVREIVREHPDTGKATSLDDDALMTLKQVAEFLQVSPSTVNNYAREGLLDKIPLGARSVRFSAVQVRRLAAAR